MLGLHGSSLWGFSVIWPFAGGAGLCACVFMEKRKRGGKTIIPGKLKIVLSAAVFAGAAVAIAALVFICRPVQAPENDIGYVIVLGGGIRRDGSVSDTLAGRLETAAGWLSAHPQAVAVVSGGRGMFAPIPESRAMALYLRARGLEPERIIEEDAARDTIQNLRFSRRIIREREGGDVPVAVLTSDFHLSRSLFLAGKAGFPDAAGISSPSPCLVRPTVYVREILAVVKLCIRLVIAPKTVTG
ncbi:MAG: YdcF family protein [Treponema sp.]|nr:YdcF family protein [Treponema sp.]